MGSVEGDRFGLPVGEIELEAELELPVGVDAAGVVVFAHGSGSNRRSPRNRMVARLLREAGLATLLLDLLTEEEQRVDELTGEHRFNIRLLAERVAGTIDWLAWSAVTSDLPVGLYGSSTGAAAALVAAAARPERVGAVVARGGRPDLAGDALAMVRAPTLLLVGSEDREVLMLNRDALLQLYCPAEVQVVEGAGHLFTEPGALEEVAHRAAAFFRTHLSFHAPAEPVRPLR